MAKQTSPKVSVIMPVYNAARFLKPALDSILEQTYADFELIAIDDGSKDASGKILDGYAARDKRMRVVHRENKGLVTTLNEAIDLARGDYLARQDADDISFLDRFAREVAALDKHPDVVLVTGSFEVFDEDDEYLYREVLPAEDEDIKRAMYLRNPIGHGSVMFRKAACVEAGMYSADCGPTEDYELWSRLARIGKFHALENATFRWRVNTRGITQNNNTLQISLMKQHIEQLWQTHPPKVFSRSKLSHDGLQYYKAYKKRGIAMKNIMLADNAQLAVKMIRHRQFVNGSRQLLAVALVGRSGLHAVSQRIYNIHRGTTQAVRRKLTQSSP